LPFLFLDFPPKRSYSRLDRTVRCQLTGHRGLWFGSWQRRDIVLCCKMCRPDLVPSSGYGIPDCKMCRPVWYPPAGTAYRTVKFTTALNPVPRLRMCGAKPPFQYAFVMCCLIKHSEILASVCSNYTVVITVCMPVSACQYSLILNVTEYCDLSLRCGWI